MGVVVLLSLCYRWCVWCIFGERGTRARAATSESSAIIKSAICARDNFNAMRKRTQRQRRASDRPASNGTRSARSLFLALFVVVERAIIFCASPWRAHPFWYAAPMYYYVAMGRRSIGSILELVCDDGDAPTLPLIMQNWLFNFLIIKKRNGVGVECKRVLSFFPWEMHSGFGKYAPHENCFSKFTSFRVQCWS